jgi:hypothetical protein
MASEAFHVPVTRILNPVILHNRLLAFHALPIERLCPTNPAEGSVVVARKIFLVQHFSAFETLCAFVVHVIAPPLEEKSHAVFRQQKSTSQAYGLFLAETFLTDGKTFRVMECRRFGN